MNKEWLRHSILLGTKVSFEGDCTVYEVADYHELLGPCPENCSHDHDCYEEPYIKVNKIIGTAFPLSKLRHVFEGHVGRAPTEEELTPK